MLVYDKEATNPSNPTERRTQVHIKRSGSSYLIRLERGEKALDSLKGFADHHRIGFAVIRAIGTFQRLTLGYYNPAEKTYEEQALDEPLEVLNLSGNITKGENGEHIVHAHVTLGRPDYTTLGGHLVEATVGPTLEVIVETLPMTIRRRHDPDVGLNLWDLEFIETLSI
jgi:predicted DNA-binding protein with PD1-like motif